MRGLSFAGHDLRGFNFSASKVDVGAFDGALVDETTCLPKGYCHNEHTDGRIPFDEFQRALILVENLLVESRFEEVIQVAAELIPLAEGDLGRDHEIVSHLIDSQSAARDALAVQANKAGTFINIQSQQPGSTSETIRRAALRKIDKLRVGESLVGEGNEVAHINLLIGPRGSAAEKAFANCLVNNKDGFTSLSCNSCSEPIDKASNCYVQQSDAQGTETDSATIWTGAVCRGHGYHRQVSEGVIPLEEADDLFICVGVFIHWEASDDRKIREYNYRATKEALDRAVKGQPLASDVVSLRSRIRHPFAT